MADRAPLPAASDEAARWARTLGGLRDPSVRIGWVRSRILGMSVPRATDVLAIVHARAEQREPAFAALMLCACLALQDPQLGRVRVAIGRVAHARGMAAFGALFDAGEAGEEAEDDGEAAAEERALKAPGPGAGARPLSLGERKSLARRRDRILLARVLRDPHPEVIRVLLDNPALVEADVVRLCARRPIDAEILTRVFQHRRWILRPSVRRTLALNPCTPEQLTLQLLPHLTSADLRDVGASLQLPERVRRASRQMPNEPPVH
jgi:hypothetical protein